MRAAAGPTSVLQGLVGAQAAGVGEELEAGLALHQALQGLAGLAGVHLRVVGPVVVPQARQLLQSQEDGQEGVVRSWCCRVAMGWLAGRG